MSTTGFALNFDCDAMRQMMRLILQEVLPELLTLLQPSSNDRIAFSEPEAAAMLGLPPHVLRDERLRKRITASSIVGRRIRYTREDLVRYLASRRTGA